MTPARLTGRDPATGERIAVHVAGGRILAALPAPPGDDSWIAPGLVDLQVNGYAGHDLNAEPDPAACGQLARALLREGTTTFVPTLITASACALLARLRAVAEARRDPLVAAMVPCIHVEGPWISPADGPRGAHPAAHVRPPDLAEFARWQEACGGLVGIVTLSPHWPGAPEVVHALAAAGVRVALGHTEASPEQVEAAAAAGATLSTHLGNGIAATLPRHPNPLWSQLAEDRLTASFIADGHHLPAAALRAMLRAKGLDRAVLVSDSVALGGMPPGEYDQPVGGRVRLEPSGRLGVLGTPYLAGAARPLAAGVATAMRDAGLSLSDALRLAAGNPGRLLGGRGTLDAGAPADLIRFRLEDGALQIETVLLRGVPQ